MARAKGRATNGPVDVDEDEKEYVNFEKVWEELLSDPRALEAVQFVKIKRSKNGLPNIQIRLNVYPSYIDLATWMRENDPTGTFVLNSDVFFSAVTHGLKVMKVAMNKMIEAKKKGKKTNKNIVLHDGFRPLKAKLIYLVNIQSNIKDICQLMVLANGMAKESLEEELITVIDASVEEDYKELALGIVESELSGHAEERMRICKAVRDLREKRKRGNG